MEYTSLDYWTRQRHISQYVFNKVMDAVKEQNTYEDIKRVPYIMQLKPPARKAILSLFAEKQAALKTFNARTVVFEKLVKQVRKDIVQVKKEQVMLSFYFWPIACYSYAITTKKGFYKITVPVETPLQIE